MDGFEYDEFGNYIGPPIQDSDVESLDGDNTFVNTTLPQSDPQYAPSATTSANPASLLTTTYLPTERATIDASKVFDENVEILVQLADTYSQFQPIMDPSLTSTLDSAANAANKFQAAAGNMSNIEAGFGPHQSYHANFIHSEPFRPPITTSNVRFEHLVQDLLGEQWLQRSFTMIGGHLHGKTSLLDLFYTQTHPHINLQTITPKAPVRGTTPHNMKPTTANTGIYQAQQSEFNPVRSNCWPVQYADAFYRERLIGHSTHNKAITIPVSAASILLDKNANNIISANSTQNKTYLFNIIDTPAHSQYIDFATAAIQRGSGSGVVLVVDCVEGVTAELATQLEYAIREANPMILVLNKFDRFITELRCPPEEVYPKLMHVLEHINSLLYQFYNMYYNTYATVDANAAAVCDQAGGQNKIQYQCPFFSPLENNVIFVSTLHCWAFTLKSFTLLHFITQDVRKCRAVLQKEFGELAENGSTAPPPAPSSSSHRTATIKAKLSSATSQDFYKFMRLLWGDIYFDAQSQKFVTTQPQQGGNRTFIDFIVFPIYKLYSACLTGNAEYIHALLESCQYTPIEEYILTKLHNSSNFTIDASLGNELYIVQQIQNDRKNNTKGTQSGTAFSDIIPPHIFSSSQDDLIREVIGKWLYYPFQKCDTSGYLKYIKSLSQQDSYENFSTYRTSFRSNVPSTSRIPLHYQQSNATITASIISSTLLDVLPPPILRKSLIQNLSIFHQPPLILGPRSKYPQHLGRLIAERSGEQQLHTNHPPNLPHSHLAIAPIQIPQSRFIPPCKVALADVIGVVPHPNGSTIDFLVRVHTLSINNDPLFTSQCSHFNSLTNSNTVAFTVGDSITLHRSRDKTYSRSHQLTAIFSPSSYRYRIPLRHCYDGNIVVLSFAPQLASLSPSQDNQTPSDLFVEGHGTFINNFAISLDPSRIGSNTNLSSGSKSTRNAAQLINLEQIDVKTLIPTFLPPITYPGNDIFQIAIEPTVASELPQLLNVINRTTTIFGNAVKITKLPSGSYSIFTRGEYLADEVIFYLRTITGNLLISNISVQSQSKRLVPPNFNQLSFSISTPFYAFREGIESRSQTPAPSMSKDGYNLITTVCEPTDFNNTAETNIDKKIFTALNTTDQNENGVLGNDLYSADSINQLLHYNNYLQWGCRNELQLTQPRNNISPSIHPPGHNPTQLLSTPQQQRIADTDSTCIFGSNRLFSMYKIFEGWDKLSAYSTPWSFGLLMDANVQFLDTVTRGTHTANVLDHGENDDDDEQNTLRYFTDNLYKGELNLNTLISGQWTFDQVSSLVNGFNGISIEGPLTESPLHNVTVQLHDAKINKLPLYSTSRYLLPTVRKSISGSFLLASPRLYEPLISGEILLLQRDEAELLKLLGSRRGQVVSTSPIPFTPYCSIKYKLPAIESMGFNVSARLIGNKQTKISGLHSGFQIMHGDPLDTNIELAHLQISHISHLPRELFVKTRRRRGLPEFALDQYFDSQMLEYLQNAQAEDDGEEVMDDGQ